MTDTSKNETDISNNDVPDQSTEEQEMGGHVSGDEIPSSNNSETSEFNFGMGLTNKKCPYPTKYGKKNKHENKHCKNHTLKKLEEYCTYKKKTHWMSSKYYKNKNSIFSIPSILISSLSGIASFLATADMMPSNASSWLNISVGVMAAASTLFQSFSNAYGYAGKEEAHQNAAESFDQIITRVRFERFNPKDKENLHLFIDDIERQIVETKQRCKYIIPEWIEKKYDSKRFKDLQNSIHKKVFTRLMENKVDKYIQEMETKDYKEIDMNQIDIELGFIHKDEDKNN